MEQLKKSLATLGLEEKAAAIYIAVLQVGSSSLADIAKRTRINRTTLYQHLDTLLDRGLISKTPKGKRILYAPENPQKILKNLERSTALFLQQAPQLEQLYKHARHTPSARVYEGLEGIMQVLLEIGSSLQPIDAFFSPEKFFRAIPPKENREFLATIEQNGTILRDLVERDGAAKRFVAEVRRSHGTFHKAKLLPEDFKVSIDMLITGDKVALISFDHMTALLIENDEIATFQRATHAFFWKHVE